MGERKEKPSEKATIESLTRSFDREIIASLEDFSDLSAGGFAFPLNGQRRAYRGWYHVPGTNTSRWCPRQSKYDGPRPGGPHKGVDLWSYEATRIIAVADGTMEYNPRSDPGGWGEHIYLYFRHGGQMYIALYAHLDPKSKFEGRVQVRAGQEIGVPGCSGNAGVNGKCSRTHSCHGRKAIDDHLHFELMKTDATKIDPVSFLGLSNIEHGDDDSCENCGARHQLGPA
jgi:murein DD-endopeptidase MepM/ murein hydrolase activator NlpD